MKKGKYLLLGLLGFILWAVPTASRADQLVDGVVAIVGNDIVLLSEVRAAQSVRKSPLAPGEAGSHSQVLDDLIQQHLVKQEMDRLGIEVSPQEQDQTIRGILYQNRITLPQLKEELAKKGISWSSYEKDLIKHIRMMKFMRQYIYSKVSVTEDDYEMYRRRYPNKSKQQSKDEMREAILEVKSRETFDAYVNGIRDRTYVEVKKLS